MIDRIGYLSDAIVQSKEMANIDPDAKVVVYRRSEFKNDNIYNIATSRLAPGLNLNRLGLFANMGLSESGFYYMWLPGLSRP
jgi:protease IV